jgi:tetratricopeptide (TPR) repeat protein
MYSKKKAPHYATFALHISITIGVLQLGGCVRASPIPEERFQQASELIDAGTGFLREQDLAAARTAFELAHELAPMAAAVDGLGCVALLEGRYPEAETLFTRAYQMDRDYDDALVNLGLVKEVQGEREEARDIYMKYLHKNPASAGVRNNLAALEYDGGRRTMLVVEALKKAVTLSNQAVIRENLLVLVNR